MKQFSVWEAYWDIPLVDVRLVFFYLESNLQVTISI